LGIASSGSADRAERLVEDENMMRLPRLTAADVNPEVEGEESDNTALQNLESTPALSGAIPIAIFDAAMAHFDDHRFALDFFDMVVEYGDLPASRKVATHVEARVSRDHPQNWCSQACRIQLPLLFVPPDSPTFPAAFKQALVRIKEARMKAESPELVSWVKGWLLKLMDVPNLDSGIKMVGDSVVRSLESS